MPHPPEPGICDRRILPRFARIRLDHHRLLSRKGPDVRGKNAEWIRAGIAPAGVCEAEGQGNYNLPICESARNAPFPLRTRTRRRGDEESSLAATRSRGADRVARVDRSRPAQAFQ